MLVNLRNFFPNFNGFIIKIENGHYGDNYAENPWQNVSDGDIFLFSDSSEKTVLVEIQGKEAKILCHDDSKSDQHTFAYIKSLRT